MLTSLAGTTDGGYLIGGYSQSGHTGNKTVGANGRLDFDFWVIKVNSSGETQWQRAFGNTGGDYLRAILPVKGGGYLLAGTTTLPESGSTNGSADFWVVRIDEQGQKVWEKCYGGSDSEQMNTAIVTNDGCFLLGGSSSSEVSGSKTALGRGGSDFWIIKIRPDGSVVWDQAYGGMRSETVVGITGVADGGYLLSGVTDSVLPSSGDVTKPSAGFSDYWVVRIDAAGKLIWEKTLGNTGQNFSVGQPIAYNGGFLIGGYQYVWPLALPLDRVDQKYSIIRLGTSGEVLWESFFARKSVATLVVSTQGDGYLAGGSEWGPEDGSGFSRYWIAFMR